MEWSFGFGGIHGVQDTFFRIVFHLPFSIPLQNAPPPLFVWRWAFILYLRDARPHFRWIFRERFSFPWFQAYVDTWGLRPL
jgi:hypothetical protein